MPFALIAFDGTDAEAPARRAAARAAHIASIAAEAIAGRLALSLPVHDEDGRSIGSLSILDVPDRAGVDAYLAAEPFAVQRVWHRVDVHQFRIAALPYMPWPAADGGAPQGRTHTIVIAFDGTGPGALERRNAVRPPHFARVSEAARSGLLALGGAILAGPEQRMIGSIAVTRHATTAAARAWWAADPYVTEGVWQEMTFHGTAIRLLAWKPLPRA